MGTTMTIIGFAFGATTVIVGGRVTDDWGATAANGILNLAVFRCTIVWHRLLSVTVGEQHLGACLVGDTS